MTDYAKPLPHVDDPIQAPFWAAAAEHRFVLQRCPECEAFRWPASPICPECLTTGGDWVEAPRGGTVWSFAIYDRAYRAEFKDDLPYDVALIVLDAGPKMMSNVVGIEVDALHIGQRVEVAFDDVTDTVTLVKFAPVDSEPDGSQSAAPAQQYEGGAR